MNNRYSWKGLQLVDDWMKDREPLVTRMTKEHMSFMNYQIKQLELHGYDLKRMQWNVYINIEHGFNRLLVCK